MEFESSYLSLITANLEKIRSSFIEILAESQTEYYQVQGHPLSRSEQLPQFKSRWIPLSENLENKQHQILKDFENWYGDFYRLIPDTPTNKNKLNSLFARMETFLKLRGDPNKKHNDRISDFEKICDEFKSYIIKLKPTTEPNLLLVVDTSALLDRPNILKIAELINITNATFVISSTIIRELDELKSGKRNDEFKIKVNTAIKHIEEITNKGNPLEVVNLEGKIFVKIIPVEPKFAELPNWLDPDVNDDRIVACAIELQRKNLASNINIVTNDTNMRLKSSMAGIPTKNFPKTFD